MEIILIILTGIIMGALLVGSFALGYYTRAKKTDENAVEITDDNKDQIKGIMNWINYRG